MTLLTGYTRRATLHMASQDIHYSCWYVCKKIWTTPYLQHGKEMDSPLQKWLLAVLRRMLGVRDTTPSWCVMRECGLEPLQFNWFCAAMRLYNPLIKSNNSYTMKKVLHADMQLSTRSKDCWSARILSAMEGLTQSYIFKTEQIFFYEWWLKIYWPFTRFARVFSCLFTFSNLNVRYELCAKTRKNFKLLRAQNRSDGWWLKSKNRSCNTVNPLISAVLW
jgi:hypothetical protein